MGASSSRDPGDIFEVVEELQRALVNVNFISLSSKLRIASEIVQKTKGSYDVCTNEKHFDASLMVIWVVYSVEVHPACCEDSG